MTKLSKPIRVYKIINHINVNKQIDYINTNKMRNNNFNELSKNKIDFQNYNQKIITNIDYIKNRFKNSKKYQIIMDKINYLIKFPDGTCDFMGMYVLGCLVTFAALLILCTIKNLSVKYDDYESFCAEICGSILVSILAGVCWPLCLSVAILYIPYLFVKK